MLSDNAHGIGNPLGRDSEAEGAVEAASGNRREFRTPGESTDFVRSEDRLFAA